MTLSLCDWMYRRVPELPRPAHPCDRRTLCVHEAGHWIVGEAFGIQQIGAAVWNTGDGWRGHVTHGYRPEPDIDVGDPRASVNVMAALQIATWYQAGVMAELVLHGADAISGAVVEDTGDARNTRKLFDLVAMHEIGSALGPLYAAQRWACEILKANWPEVKRAATVLEQRGTIEASDLQRQSA